MSEPEVDGKRMRELAALARLPLSPDQEDKVARRLCRVLEAFGSLRGVKVDGVPRSPYPLTLPTVLRPDDPGPCLPPTAALANTKHTAGGCFLVPRTVEG